jgi:hypothetical protein
MLRTTGHDPTRLLPLIAFTGGVSDPRDLEHAEASRDIRSTIGASVLKYGRRDRFDLPQKVFYDELIAPGVALIRVWGLTSITAVLSCEMTY